MTYGRTPPPTPTDRAADVLIGLLVAAIGVGCLVSLAGALSSWLAGNGWRWASPTDAATGLARLARDPGHPAAAFPEPVAAGVPGPLAVLAGARRAPRLCSASLSRTGSCCGRGAERSTRNAPSGRPRATSGASPYRPTRRAARSASSPAPAPARTGCSPARTASPRSCSDPTDRASPPRSSCPTCWSGRAASS